MSLVIVGSESRVIVETAARGLLASVAHDLRIEAPVAGDGDDAHAIARFAIVEMKVAEARRHGTSEWHAPKPSDAADIESRIRDHLFRGDAEVVVHGTLEGSRAVLEVRARKTTTVTTPVTVDRTTSGVRVRGECTLSLSALGTGDVHVPLGAVKLDDHVTVTFDVVFRR